jgi:hypothetical protein
VTLEEGHRHVTPRQDRWQSFHLYYHEDLNRAVLGFARPVVSRLLDLDAIDSFFFVRYGLGGPHLRLRLRVRAGNENLVADLVGKAAETFLTGNPSQATLAAEAIERETKAILAADPGEKEDSSYADNTFHAASFEPEVERYGGTDLLPASLDFFALSSVAALRFQLEFNHESRATRVGGALRLLLRQSLGFCATLDELVSCLSYGIHTWATSLPGVAAKGHQVYAAKPAAFLDLFCREIKATATEDGGTSLARTGAMLGEAARRLSWEVAPAAAARRLIIGSSHLHMTANRLGLSNPEELYVSCLLTDTATSLLASGHEASERMKKMCAASRQPVPGKPLAALLPAFLLELRGAAV